MRRAFRPVTVSVLAVVTGTLLLTPTAAAVDTPDDGPVSRSVATTDHAEQRLLTYWTEERMRQATPVDRLLRKRDAPSGEKVERGDPEVVEPTLAGIGGVLDGLLDVLSSGEPWPGGGAIETTAGRVFFTLDGNPASCSGNAVASANKSVVVTAGHCVKYGGGWNEDWVFVPGYDDGERPHGTWTGARAVTTPQWDADEDLDYDVGAVVVNPRGGERLTDAAGGQGIAFNQDRGQQMYSFGYPAEDPYEGEELIYCSGRVYDDPLTNAHGLGCDMTGGASGGPWFLDFDDSTGAGIQNSLNSFKYVFLPTAMYGPYFGDEAKDVYERASSSTMR